MENDGSTESADTPFLQAAFHVIAGGLIVLATGILIGKS